MVKSFPKIEQEDIIFSEDRDKFCFENLDLLNLRLFPCERLENKRERICKSNLTNKLLDRGLSQSRHRHSLEKSETRSLVPNLTKLPQGYANIHSTSSTIPSENLVLLYSKQQLPEYVSTEPITDKDFLFPSKKKTRTQIIDVISENRMPKFNSPKSQENSDHFPFKVTPSGNLKVDSSQVVFTSNKLSVLVADPKVTKVNVYPETTNFGINNKMTHEPELSKNSAMDTIMSQAGFSSLGTLIGHTPIRSGNKEASEYESKQTSEILDPELNLGRLGYSGTDDISWQKVALPEKKNLYLELYSRITNYTNADCKVYIDNEEFNCHLIVLQCYSELFDAYIAVKKVELPSDKCTATSFAFIYEWMITGEPSYRELTRDNVLDIFNSAKYLKIKDLVEQCWAFIDHNEVFYEDTAFLLYMDAKEKNLIEVRELMLPRIQGFFLMLVSSQNWLELEVEDVKNFLKSNYICVNCEMEVFMSAVRWLKHDWANRDRYKYDLLDCVRFGNIAPWQLVDIKRNPENPDFLELAKDPRICKMIDDGLAYVIIKYWYGQENDDFQHWNAVLGLQEPPPRNWSGSDKTYFTYREFLIYLDQYRRNQLIEKNKPKMSNDKERGDAKETLRKPINITEQDSPRVPTMEEFLSKKKVSGQQRKLNRVISKSMMSVPTILTPNTTEKLSVDSEYWTQKKIYAALIIQRAYRRYKRRELIKKIKSENNKNIQSNSKSLTNILKMFRISEKQNNVTHTRTIRDLTEKASLFHKTRETVLVFGGFDPHSYDNRERLGTNIYSYMPIRNRWVCVGELPEARHNHCTEFYKGRIFLAGGCDPTKSNDVSSTVWSIDPVTRKWAEEPSMLDFRKNFGLVGCNQGLYAIGGQGNDFLILSSVEKYDDKKKLWKRVSSMLRAKAGFGCTKYRHSIWVAGGFDEKDNCIEILDSVETYDIKTDQWTRVQYLLRYPRCFFSMIVLSQKMYIIGGARKASEYGSCSTGDVDVWKENKLEWVMVTNMNIPRHGHAVSYLGTQILVVGGVTSIYGRALNNIECFCCQRETWVRGLGCLPAPLSGHSMITLPPASLLYC
ncbi:uncharacterized protein LOC126888626 [Diabrotica virgifera virgifera]|uniref:BTB domain-containing protein n=1 Tax=Diabrotica virgifera virgifera TaxID=50390 RepID=A0ABM5KRX8_DIAVI|nr:uncharacterized protein LOC126888626 [Diabrotica virgifera virgifera]